MMFFFSNSQTYLFLALRCKESVKECEPRNFIDISSTDINIQQAGS
jgi:hypothetical protein